MDLKIYRNRHAGMNNPGRFYIKLRTSGRYVHCVGLDLKTKIKFYRGDTGENDLVKVVNVDMPSLKELDSLYAEAHPTCSALDCGQDGG